MIVEDQAEAIAFLSDPALHGGHAVETIETHISHIFMAGERVFKMKRAVKLPYADFSTPELRLAACRKEVELNSRTAPDLYLGTRRLTRAPGGRLGLDGEGELVEAVVEMVRFDQKCLFDRMAAEGRLTPELMTGAAHMIAQFHRTAPSDAAGTGRANMEAVLDINEAGFAGGELLSPGEISQLAARFRERLGRHAELLDRRAAAGKVRRCHGDLHLRNICLIDGEPRLFDCIEFNERIATVDILYDLAFLLMDLWHRGLPHFANLVANRYLDDADDEDGFTLLPFFMAVRAAVRAHVAGTLAAEGGPGAADAGREARSYLALARLLLEEKPPRLVAIGGFSGSGKTTVAETLAAHIGTPPGARIVESDRVRKAMHGVPAETRLPAKAYRPEVSSRVYREMGWRAALILAEGGSVVANAVFDRAPDRALIAKAARDSGVPFLGIWLDADPALLWKRVEARRAGPSDATVDVLSRQLERRTAQADWHRMDAARPPRDTAAAILALGEDGEEPE